MRSSISALDSSEHAPSAWQALFGKQKMSQVRADTRERQRHAQQPGLASPSIADQLLSALNAREKKQKTSAPEEELSQQCANQLLGGKRNAFVPELRMNQFQYQDGDTESPRTADAMVDAQEIIKNRFQLENQADALRPHKKQTGRAREAPARTREFSAAADAKAPRKPVSDRLRDPQYSKSKLFELDELPKVTKRGVKKAETEPEKIISRQVAASSNNSFRNVSTSSNNNDNVRDTGNNPRPARLREDQSRTTITASSNPLKQMEERQQRLREARATRAAQQHEHSTISAASRSKNSRNNPNNDDDGRIDRDTRDERLVQEKIERLASENQRAIEIQEQQRVRQHLRKLNARVFAIWKHQSDARKLQEVRAKQVFEWRLMQIVWRNWKRCTQSMAVERAEQETRARLVREKQCEARANAFRRQKQLPKWFFRWLASVRARKDAKELESAQQKRKEQAQRLVERLTRNKTRQANPDEEKEEKSPGSPEEIDLEIEIQAQDEAKPEARSGHTRKATAINTSQQPKARAAQSKAAWEVEESSGSSPPPQLTSLSPAPSSSRSNGRNSKAPPPVDPLYVSMQERAAERKQRRDLLKQKYEQLELEKREATALQVAEREAQLLQQKLDERERIRERKRQEALTAHEKTQRIEALDAQRRQAKRYDYKRLVFYYGFLPLKRQWELSKRIAASASEWHQLRVLHTNWHFWRDFVHARHVARQQIERQKLAIAAKHHALTLKRQSFQQFKSFHQRILNTEIAIQRQRQWNLMKRSWSYWQRAFTVSCMQQQAQLREAEARLNESRLRRVWLQWRTQVTELREERELQQEKQRMWTKVRGWLNE